MKKRLLPLALVTLMATSCNGAKSLSVAQMQKHLENVSTEELYPYYRVRGAIDFNDTYFEVDANFTNQYKDGKLVPYTRYHPGTYDSQYDPTGIDVNDILTFANGSKGYWTHVPMRINSKNFYGELEGKEGKKIVNSTSAYYYILHYIKSWIETNSKNANTPGEMIMEITKDGGFTFSGSAIHSKITIDNFPEYPDYINNPHFQEMEYEFVGPYPMFGNTIDGVFNFRFEYNKDGWLTREMVVSTNYQPNVSSKTHFYCEAIYTYEFGK